MTTPREPDDDARRGSRLPPHLDPRGARRTETSSVPRVTGATRRPAPAAPAPDSLRSGHDRSRGQRFGRALSWLALSMSIVILGVAGVGWAVVRHYDGNIKRLDVFGHSITGKARPAAAPHHAQNILLVGSDSRAGSNGNGTGGSALTTGQRADAVLLAHLYGNSDKIEVVSFPRDSYVEIPAYTNRKTGVTHHARHDKLNSALAEGGQPLLIATLEKLTNVRIDHYVQVDFNGFKSMVNKLGGVDICLKTAAKDHYSKIDLSAGRHHIDGTVALQFVRQRHQLAGGDLDRIGRQQQLLGSMVHKVLSAGTLLDPFKLNGFLNVATASLQVDENLDIKDLALRLRNFNSKSVLFTTVPVANAAARVNGVSVVKLDETAGAKMFDALRRDEAPGTKAKAPKATPGNLTVAPAKVRVRVYNGSGVAGLGRKAFNDLTNVGFATTGSPSNRSAGADQTVITYGPGKADSAKTLAASLPGSVLKQDAALSGTLEVVVGKSYTTAKKVTVASATPSSSPSAAAKIRTAQDDPCAA